jgi:hypothetical protein
MVHEHRADHASEWKMTSIAGMIGCTSDDAAPLVP